MVKKPTSDNNTLDFFLTNHPNLVQSTKTLPPLGPGDHDIVHHELKIKLGRNIKSKGPSSFTRKQTGFRMDMAEYQTEFFKLSENMNTNSNGICSNLHLTNCLINFIPTNSLVENQNDPELYLKVFFFLVVQALYLMNPTDATLASLSVLKY